MNPLPHFDFDKAESFMYKNNDSAFYYFSKLIANSKDSLQIAISCNYLYVIQFDAGDYFGSQESLLTSLRFLDQNNPKHFNCLSANYNGLGRSSTYLKNHDDAIKYYDAAIKFSTKNDLKLLISNNEALVYRSKKDYTKAIKIYKEILYKNPNNKIEYARKLTNFAFTKWLQNPDYNAEPELLEALHIREKENNDWGKNSSYTHLSDYYASKQPAIALAYAQKMYQVATKIKSPNDRLDALHKLIKLSPQTEIRNYFNTYHALSDSLQSARNAAKNQFALIRYESDKNKTDNLNLQKENAEKRHQITIREFMLFGALLFLFSASFIAYLWYKRRKLKLETAAQSAIQDSQLKTSKKVHDVVANGLYRMMREIENGEDINKDNILDKIDNLYEKSRDISYDKPELADHNFHEKISALLKSFATENTRILIVGNTAALWEKVNPTVKYEVEHMLQELMVNMRKHSGADKVLVKFEHKEDRININYTDNGIGMSEATIFKNGLRNTGNRIACIHGEITFDTQIEKGLKIQLSFPIY
ncbi:ATP-binding protein [Pedobacter gandavensis]|uniref:tetratricopeptide repeat-containing sensor histidine kinase n=1 Tax=Pedobacter gandavensis TaxID=2679963 RepID=UPI00292D0DA5|nr:ATP-binding protein [Pedobacter gandavensis]